MDGSKIIKTVAYREFTTNIYYSQVDKILFGKLIGLDDLILFEGRTIEELQQNMKEAVDDYINI